MFLFLVTYVYKNETHFPHIFSHRDNKDEVLEHGKKLYY